MVFTWTQTRSLTIVATITSSLSMFGSLAVLASYYSKPKMERKELGTRMVMYASYLDFIASLAFSFGTVFTPNSREEPSDGCLAQAFLIQFGHAARRPQLYIFIESLRALLRFLPVRAPLLGGAVCPLGCV